MSICRNGRKHLRARKTAESFIKLMRRWLKLVLQSPLTHRTLLDTTPASYKGDPAGLLKWHKPWVWAATDTGWAWLSCPVGREWDKLRAQPRKTASCWWQLALFPVYYENQILQMLHGHAATGRGAANRPNMWLSERPASWVERLLPPCSVRTTSDLEGKEGRREVRGICKTPPGRQTELPVGWMARTMKVRSSGNTGRGCFGGPMAVDRDLAS